MDAVPSPKAILRGHKAQVHTAIFIRNNSRLVTGDAEGYVVLWDLTVMRPKAVWRAHESAILGIRGWGSEKLITGKSHGRDHKLVFWKLGLDDEERMSVALPVEDVAAPRPQPWLLHLLEVNTMNFCAFGACSASSAPFDDSEDIFVAVPNTLASEAIDIYSLPSQTRIHTIRPGEKFGMAMCLALLQREGALTLIAAFENGYATVHRLAADGQWTTTYRAQAHQQPILSLDVHPDQESFLTSGADAIIARHPIPVTQQQTTAMPTSNERVVEIVDDDEPNVNQSPSLLSAALKKDPARASGGGRPGLHTWKEWEAPLKVFNTKHSGQQSLRIRPDGRIFATAGWDSKVRVYSAKTMKELAVLKWHQVGCYAAAFANVTVQGAQPQGTQTEQGLVEDAPWSEASPANSTAVTRMGANALVRGATSVKERRLVQAKETHWIAAGAKDGKISLWDIY